MRSFITILALAAIRDRLPVPSTDTSVQEIPYILADSDATSNFADWRRDMLRARLSQANVGVSAPIDCVESPEQEARNAIATIGNGATRRGSLWNSRVQSFKPVIPGTVRSKLQDLASALDGLVDGKTNISTDALKFIIRDVHDILADVPRRRSKSFKLSDNPATVNATTSRL
ncbi:hypothetical protein H0H92_000753 [Tricholoma furcatifolium]|nr:hypothetical protein H0H92_000753 [Tricholoma furcatifolium]